MAREHNYLVTTTWTGASDGPTLNYKGYSRTYLQAFGDKLELTGSADPAFLGDATLVNPEDLLVAALVVLSHAQLSRLVRPGRRRGDGLRGQSRRDDGRARGRRRIQACDLASHV